MSNTYGSAYRFTIFGQSHAPAIGVTIEGLPAGSPVDLAVLQAFLDRRAPGKGPTSTARREADIPEVLCGLGPDGRTCGSPLTLIIRNGDTRSGDYDTLRRVPRPGHADWPAMVRFGPSRDYAGGGQFSGRLTAPLCIAGGIALQQLEAMGIRVEARILSIGGEEDPEKLEETILAAAAAGDSVGGVIECTVLGCPAGVGDPMFGGLENRIAQAVFGIPAVKGIEFGAGFAAAAMRGSENNDPFIPGPEGTLRTEGNNHGGILGGMSTGMPILFRAAVKPTPSIAREQRSVDVLTGQSVPLKVTGRHDPCIVPRAVPCMEAAAAAAVYDAILERR
jgi:chorismate synthase